ncbi:MAG: VanW family protein [Eubacteriales bacterium]
MKHLICGCLGFLLTIGIFLQNDVHVYAAQQDSTFLEGIWLEEMNLSGLTQIEAVQLIESHIKEIRESTIVLEDSLGHQLTLPLDSLDVQWNNQEVLEEAIEFGQSGNIIQRYKDKSDLNNVDKIIFPLEITYNKSTINELLVEEADLFTISKKNASLTRTAGEFLFEEGHSGYSLDITNSTNLIYDSLLAGYRGSDLNLEAILIEEEPLGSEQELGLIKDVLGTFTTSYTTSSSGRVKNIQVATNSINGTILYPGEEYSTRQAMLPFNASKGYEMGGSFADGVLVESYGGGVCQVSTTLYNAILLSELEITERNNHSMTVSYVPRAQDAAVSEGGLDLKFVNNLDYPIYIEGSNTTDKRCTFTIYGVETRPENRSIVMESEVTEIIAPGAEVITPVAQGIGFVTVNSAYTGYRSRLWKNVYENGVIVDRIQINSSIYKAVARSASVGVYSDNPTAVAEINAAITTGSIDHVRAVAAAWSAAFAAEAAVAAGLVP